MTREKRSTFQKNHECAFDKAWIGPCGKPVPDGQKFCEVHQGSKCDGCGGQAILECPDAGSLVCGAPLCGECEGYQDKSAGRGWQGFIGSGIHRHRRRAT
jgi:hypothetical protein